jgi:hypothetical protein
VTARPGQALIGDKSYFGCAFEDDLTERDTTVLRPVRKGWARRADQEFLKRLRQIIESAN